MKYYKIKEGVLDKRKMIPKRYSFGILSDQIVVILLSCKNMYDTFKKSLEFSYVLQHLL